MGALRKFLLEALDSMDEEAWVPGRWMPGEGEPVSRDDAERLGEADDDLEETDLRMLGDGRGPGDPDEENEKIADHLRGDEEKTSLGDPPDEVMGEGLLRRELRRFFLQEGPAGASGSDPQGAKGAYAAFDMDRDHGNVAQMQGAWYRSPGREAGQDGDPFRVADPFARLGFHPPEAGNDPTASPPAADGETGAQARLAPPIWQLSAGGDTSSVLGANARPASGGVGSDGEQEEGTEGTEGEGGGSEEGTPEGGKPGQGRPQRGRD